MLKQLIADLFAKAQRHSKPVNYFLKNGLIISCHPDGMIECERKNVGPSETELITVARHAGFASWDIKRDGFKAFIKPVKGMF